jgi:hypothetical protein
MAEVVERGGEELILQRIGFETENLGPECAIEADANLERFGGKVGTGHGGSGEDILFSTKLLKHFADATDSWGVRPDYSGGFRKFTSAPATVTPGSYTNPFARCLRPAANPACFHIAPDGDRLIHELIWNLLDQTSIQQNDAGLPD